VSIWHDWITWALLAEVLLAVAVIAVVVSKVLPTKGNHHMALNLGSLKQDLDSAVTAAVNIADLVDKVADVVEPFVAEIPDVGGDATIVVAALNELDAALKKVQSLLADA
jgi:hypothetical protein